MLREGPTPENVRLLMESGHANWFFYNLDPEQYAPPIDLSPDMADDWAEQLEEYWSGEREMDDNYESLMLIMGMLASRARMAQEGIGDITEDEMAILENFYSALEEARADQGGVVGFPDYLPPQGMDQEEADRVMGIIGDGLIMLSNEDFGGGYDLLPASVRHTANGYFLDPEYLSEEWVGDMRNLAKIFEHVDASMSPGEALGGALHTSIGVYFADGGPVNFDYDGFFSEILEIAYRNEDLNLSLLDGSFEHPSVEDPSSITIGGENIDDMEDLITKTMASLYSHDWDDDGKAMSLLTEWIHADAPDVPIPEGEGIDLTVEQERAVEGLEAFMRRMEDDDFFQAVQATGNSAEDVDGVDGVDWENVSAGHLNPELAMGWAELFSTYIDSFGDAANIPDHEKETSWNPESGAFEMSQAGRLRFAELIVADEDAAARLASEVVRFGIESVEEVGLTGSGEQAQRAGILRGILEEALEREGENRGDQHTETAGYKNKIAALGVDIAAGQAADMGVPSPMAEFLKFQAKEALEVPGKDGSPSIDMSVLDEMVIQSYAEIYTLTTMANNDEKALWKVFEAFPEIVETESVSGQEIPVRISEDPDDWAVTLGRQSSFSQDAHQLVSDEEWIHGDMNAGDVYAIFDKGYERFSDSWSFVDR